MGRYCQLAGGGGILCRHAHSLLRTEYRERCLQECLWDCFYTVFHKIGTPLYFWNNFFKCWSIWMKITSLYSLGNLLSDDVVCNCIFYKYSYVCAHSMRSNNQILHGDQTRCEEDFTRLTSNTDARSVSGRWLSSFKIGCLHFRRTSVRWTRRHFDLSVSAVIATATWLAGWVGGWVGTAAVCHSWYYIKTTKPILKLFGSSGSPIIEAFGTPYADTKF